MYDTHTHTHTRNGTITIPFPPSPSLSLNITFSRKEDKKTICGTYNNFVVDVYFMSSIYTAITGVF